MQAMGTQLTLSEKVRIVRLYSLYGTYPSIQRVLYQESVLEGKWGKIGVDRADVSSRKAIEKVNKLFDATGSVEKRNLKSFTRKRTITTAENLAMVREEVLKSPDVSKSHRRLSATLGLSSRSIYVILKELKLNLIFRGFVRS